MTFGMRFAMIRKVYSGTSDLDTVSTAYCVIVILINTRSYVFCNLASFSDDNSYLATLKAVQFFNVLDFMYCHASGVFDCRFCGGPGF